MMTSFEVNHYHVPHNVTCQLRNTEKIKNYEAKTS